MIKTQTYDSIVLGTVYDPTKVDPRIGGVDESWVEDIGSPGAVLALDLDLGCGHDSAAFVAESAEVDKIVEILESKGVSVGYDTPTEEFEFQDGVDFCRFRPLGDGQWVREEIIN